HSRTPAASVTENTSGVPSDIRPANASHTSDASDSVRINPVKVIGRADRYTTSTSSTPSPFGRSSTSGRGGGPEYQPSSRSIVYTAPDSVENVSPSRVASITASPHSHVRTETLRRELRSQRRVSRPDRDRRMHRPVHRLCRRRTEPVRCRLTPHPK